MNEFDEIKKVVDKSKFDGYKAAFLGAMGGWEKSIHLAVKYIEHVTGTGGDSVEHYWKNDCETCIEIAKFIQDWKSANNPLESRGAVEHTLAGGQGVCVCEKEHDSERINGVWVCCDCKLPLAAERARDTSRCSLPSSYTGEPMKLTDEKIISLAKFALDVLKDWPDMGGLDPCDVQDLAEKHNLLIPQIVHKPCSGELCVCAEICSADEFARGVTCYHRAEWLRRAAEQQDEASGETPNSLRTED